MKNDEFGCASPEIMEIENKRDELMLKQDFIDFDNTNKSTQIENREFESNEKRDSMKINDSKNR